MILMGDEYGHTRFGNNNTWCQDNDLNWYLWDKLQENRDWYRFAKGAIRLRRDHEIFRIGKFLTDEEIDWHGIHPGDPDWDGDTHTLAFTLKDHNEKKCFYLAFNMHFQNINFHLPPPPSGGKWKLIVDTGTESFNDFYEFDQAPDVEQEQMELKNHSSILLMSIMS